MSHAKFPHSMGEKFPKTKLFDHAVQDQSAGTLNLAFRIVHYQRYNVGPNGFDSNFKSQLTKRPMCLDSDMFYNLKQILLYI